MDLFGRQWVLTVGDLDLSDFDLEFKIERTTHRNPNAAEIKIWNLARETRATVEGGGLVRLRAGYADPPMIFSGDSRAIWTVPDKVDRVTWIRARDGGNAYANAEISQGYGPGTPVIHVLDDVIRAMGIGRGNVADFAAAFALRNGSNTFADGYVAHGLARTVLNDIIRGARLRWSIQFGSLQILASGEPLQSETLILSSDTGLVDSPTWDERGQRTGGRQGVLTAKCLIQGGLEPGRQVQIEGDQVTGTFEIRKTVYTGNTRGQDWYANLELRNLST